MTFLLMRWQPDEPSLETAEALCISLRAESLPAFWRRRIVVSRCRTNARSDLISRSLVLRVMAEALYESHTRSARKSE